MGPLGMQVLVETDNGILADFPRAIYFGDKIDDNLVKSYLRKTKDKIDYDSEVEPDVAFYANEITRLILVIVDFETEDVYFEVLDPYKFWPYIESKEHAAKRAKYRE